MSSILIGESLPNIPWQERPHNCNRVIWRYSQNPVIPRNLIACSDSIFNSAVVPFKGAFAGIFRCDSTTKALRIHSGKSKDGLDWQIDEKPIEFICSDSEFAESGSRYDPRVAWIEDRYWITWCQDYHGPTIAVAYTYDFEQFHQIEHAFLPYNRNAVLFPRKINSKYAMLSRPSDKGHTPFGDIYFSDSSDMEYWGHHRFVMGTTRGWQKTKLGPGPVPIETKEGWLLFYHGVMTTCNGFIYSMGACLLDLEQPWKVRYRTEPYLLTPETNYECVGNVPNVVFPCAALSDADTGRICIYYGCADTATGMAFTKADELIEFVKSNSKL